MNAQQLAQRRKANQRSIDVRSFRGKVKRDLRSGLLTLPEVLRDDDERLENMRVADLLLAVPALGAVKVRHVLKVQRLTDRSTLGGLTPFQKSALVDYISKHFPAVGQRLAGRTPAQRISDLEARVAGLENLLAELTQDGRIMVTVPISQELEQERPSPAYGRES